MAVDRPLIGYCDIVRSFGWNSAEANAYKQYYKDDEAFQRRAVRIDCLIGIKPGSILGYVQIIEEHGVGSWPATVYLTGHGHDEVLQRLAQTFNGFFAHAP